MLISLINMITFYFKVFSTSLKYLFHMHVQVVLSCKIFMVLSFAQSVSNVDLDWMDQPPASIVIQGQLRPAFAEESINIKKLPYSGIQKICNLFFSKKL